MMLGLGETRDEVVRVFDDLRAAGCSLLSLGQYLAPSGAHAPVIEYITPEAFEQYRQEALRRGFCFVKSGPYVRSSYAAGEYCAGAGNS
jgi:lipoyl synthase